ncbi:hypothetical protein [Martelella soudanensis]|uniref:hypothetical protein n=1 Tax=unclassified Martelella TaxID=2629616 RepID=UPI0015DEBB9C|nr:MULTISPECIES: hypothetical protein [unclassified Martelella]
MLKSAFLAMTTAGLIAATPCAFAGYQEWTVEIDEDPFDNKGSLAMSYFEDASGALLVLCEEGSNAIIFRLGISYSIGTDGITDRPLSFGIIIDKFESHLGFARASVIGENTVAIDFPLEDEPALRLLEEMRDGQSKIYVKLADGDPVSYPLRGSTRAATKAISYCFGDDQP